MAANKRPEVPEIDWDRQIARMHTMYREVMGDPDRVACEFCGAEISRKSIARHRRTHAAVPVVVTERRRMATCETCGKEVSTKSIAKHRRSHARMEAPAPQAMAPVAVEKGKAVCETCGLVVSTKSIAKHRRAHLPAPIGAPAGARKTIALEPRRPMWVCPYCAVKISPKSAVRHVRRKHDAAA